MTTGKLLSVIKEHNIDDNTIIGIVDVVCGNHIGYELEFNSIVTDEEGNIKSILFKKSNKTTRSI